MPQTPKFSGLHRLQLEILTRIPFNCIVVSNTEVVDLGRGYLNAAKDAKQCAWQKELDALKVSRAKGPAETVQP